jgi:hypothetical protein
LAAGPETRHRKDAERWIGFDGPEPAHLGPLLSALRDRRPATPEDKERVVRRYLEERDATRAFSPLRRGPSRSAAGQAATEKGELR